LQKSRTDPERAANLNGRTKVKNESIVRLAVLADHDQCAEIFLAVRRKAFDWVEPERFALSDYEKSTVDEEIWAATRDGRLEGFVTMFLPDNFLHHLFVHPRAQRRGIGTELLAVADRRLGRPASLKCLEQNTLARRFYRMHGWVEGERGDDSLGSYIVCTKTE
jgi:GNAT superfamily N-acetyltransferase